MTDWLRLVIIIGGYILLRPILIRFGAKMQEKQLEKEEKTESNEGVVKEKKLDTKAKDDLQWGVKARIRQRKLNEGHIQDGEESDSDEIDEFLE
jgi:flagellar biosynthesis/type III secretory pathway M-ring protein FliF/YscJ